MRRVVGFLLLWGLLAAGAPSATGQNGPRYGLTVGYNWATLNSPADLGAHSAFVGGVVLRQSVYGPLSIQPELLLNQKGAEVEGEDQGGIAYGAGYVEVPVLLHVKTPTVGPVTFHVEAGGYGGVKVFERSMPASGRLNIPLGTETSFYRRLDAGAVAGVGATVSFRDRRLNVTLRRAWGRVEVAKEVENQPFPDAPFPEGGKTRTLSLLLRFGF